MTNAEELLAAMQAQVGEGQALVALSGGVDSFVAATLAQRALGERLHPVLVDHGLLREGEREEVEAAAARVGMNLHTVDAASRFLAALRGVTDPEEKRRRIGHLFIEIFEEAAGKLQEAYGPIGFLVQGTILPDVRESHPQGNRGMVKSHHNVGGLPEAMALTLVEPLRHLDKPQVRELGRSLGVPEAIITRQPFPGPGLAVRVVGEVTEERLARVRRADAIVRHEVEGAGWKEKLWQYFALLTGAPSVGYREGRRVWGEVLAVRAVVAQRADAAQVAPFPPDFLFSLAEKILSEVPGLSRVVFDITGKPPATIEWE
ncbi:MAG: glutamine-hydrolyzing GMP synthase [Bacillota bacterium]|nr:glutamine-hydrolyzing GMP synthase [Bacillota bacterium]